MALQLISLQKALGKFEGVMDPFYRTMKREEMTRLGVQRVVTALRYLVRARDRDAINVAYCLLITEFVCGDAAGR